jgi:hypothetical protein
VASAGRQKSEVSRERAARWRPNWWVILAVCLALIALLVESSGRGEGGRPVHIQSVASTRGPLTRGLTRTQGVRSGARPSSSSSTTTSTSAPPATTPDADRTPAFGAGGSDSTVDPPASTTTTTYTPSPPTTSTSAPPTALAADRSQTEGYFDPPLQTSGQYEVNGSGPTEVSVLWSAPVYLTMTVTCPSGSQTVGGTTAMETSVPDASAGCQATVSEPSTESTSLTYSVTFGPAGG